MYYDVALILLDIFPVCYTPSRKDTIPASSNVPALYASPFISDHYIRVPERCTCQPGRICTTFINNCVNVIP